MLTGDFARKVFTSITSSQPARVYHAVSCPYTLLRVVWRITYLWSPKVGKFTIAYTYNHCFHLKKFIISSVRKVGYIRLNKQTDCFNNLLFPYCKIETVYVCLSVCHWITQQLLDRFNRNFSKHWLIDYKFPKSDAGLLQFSIFFTFLRWRRLYYRW